MKTINDIITYKHIANLWLNKNEENKHTKLGHAIIKNDKRISELLIPYNELLELWNETVKDIEDFHQLTDKDNRLLWDILKNRNGDEVRIPAYSKEGAKQKEEELRKAKKNFDKKLFELLESTVEIDSSHLLSDFPDTLTADEKIIFDGIIISSK